MVRGPEKQEVGYLELARRYFSSRTAVIERRVSWNAYAAIAHRAYAKYNRNNVSFVREWRAEKFHDLWIYVKKKKRESIYDNTYLNEYLQNKEWR